VVNPPSHSSRRFGQVVPFPIRAFAVIVIVRRAFAKQAMEMTEYGKVESQESGFPPFTIFGNPFGITTFPRPRLLAFFKVQEQKRPNARPLDFKGVVRMARHCHPWHGGSKGHHGQSDDAAPCQTRYHGNLHARELWEGAGCSARVHEVTAADEARLGVNPMKSSNHRVGHRFGNLVSGTTTDFQMVESSEDKDGGRYRIRTYDFHRVKVALYR
jgi:hypothetical protein